MARIIYEKDCKNTIVFNGSRLSVACVGTDDLVVVSTDDALLVIDRKKCPDIKKYISEMKSGASCRLLFFRTGYYGFTLNNVCCRRSFGRQACVLYH
jgi:hypothetical protein